MDKWREVGQYVHEQLQIRGFNAGLGISRSAARQITATDIVSNMARQLPGCHLPLAECSACRNQLDVLVRNVIGLMQLEQGASK